MTGPGHARRRVVLLHSAFAALLLTLVVLPGRAAAQVTAALPDLSIASLAAKPSPARPGDAVTVSVKVRNVAKALAGPTRVDVFFLSSPNSSLEGVEPLASVELPGLGAKATTTRSAVMTLPMVAPGTYHLVAVVDPSNAVAETRETNNRRATRIAVAVPELTIRKLTVSPSTAQPGQVVTARVEIQNRGRVPSYPGTADVFLATGDGSDPGLPLGSAQLPAIGPKRKTTVTIPVTAPKTAPGDYVLVVQLDAGGPVAALRTMTAAAEPVSGGAARPRKSARLKIALTDLAVSALSATPARTRPGASLEVALTVRNASTLPAAATTVGVYLTAGPGDSAPGVATLATIAVPALRAGASQKFRATAAVPAIAPGAYQVVAVVDPTNALAEIDEGNNRAAVALDVAGSETDLTVWVVDSLTRVQRTDPPGTGTTATIKAARNEYEAFQVVIRAPDDRSLSRVNVVASDLVGPGVIPSRHVALYREHYVRVTTPSPGSPYPPGWWPDALIPFVHPETGQPLTGGRFEAAPFTVPAGQNQPVWVDVYVPKGTPAGMYSGTLTVTADGTAPMPVEVSLTVWGFTLPEIPALRSDFGSLSELNDYYGLSNGRDYVEMEARYMPELLAHRIQFGGPTSALPSRAADGSITVSAEVHAAFQDWFTRGNGYRIPFYAEWPFADPLGADRTAAIRYLRSFAQYLRTHGWLAQAYVYVVDEPSSAQAYQLVRAFGDLLREADPELKHLTTEQPDAEDARWGSLVGAVDIWTPLFDLFDPAAVAARLSAGDEVWTYTALHQGAARGVPVWLLDYPLVHYRVHAWINARYKVTGLLYWDTMAGWGSDTDPWTNPATYVSGGATFNGEGHLVYPGPEVGYDGPIASIRLKALRSGMQDYDYLALLANLGDPQLAAQLAATIGASWTTWSEDPALFDAAREQAALRILDLGGE